MSLQETIEVVNKQFTDIANMHDKSLESTERVPGWSATYLKFLSLKRMINADKLSGAADCCDNVIEGLNGLVSRIDPLIAEGKLDDAKNMLRTMIDQMKAMKSEMTSLIASGSMSGGSSGDGLSSKGSDASSSFKM